MCAEKNKPCSELQFSCSKQLWYGYMKDKKSATMIISI